jgi:RNA recognition motif-containing protein
MEAFKVFGDIKDIRMVKDRSNQKEEFKEYAFIEYFNLDDSNKALENLKKNTVSIRGCNLMGKYSKIKKDLNDYNFNNKVLIFF